MIFTWIILLANLDILSQREPVKGCSNWIIFIVFKENHLIIKYIFVKYDINKKIKIINWDTSADATDFNSLFIHYMIHLLHWIGLLIIIITTSNNDKRRKIFAKNLSYSTKAQNWIYWHDLFDVCKCIIIPMK